MNLPKFIEPSVTVYSLLREKRSAAYDEWTETKISLLDITEEEWKNIKAAAILADEANKRTAKIRTKAFHVAKSLIKELFKDTRSVIRYIENQSLYYELGRYVRSYEMSYNEYQELLKRKEAQATEEKKHRDLESLKEEAINWLIARNKKLGTDFTIQTAVMVANAIAYDEEVARIQKSSNGPFTFGGDENCENCSGWDGINHRCCCGNRRVNWVASPFHSFKDPSVYAEAY